ncbi:hypothetical protein [Flavobacterium sp.]
MFHKVFHDVRNAAFDKLPSTSSGTDDTWFGLGKTIRVLVNVAKSSF